MPKIPIPLIGSAILAIGIATAGCSPKFNWRDFRSPDAPYTAMFPAKPASYSRPVNLDGLTVQMTMTAAEVDGVTFAIGNAELESPAQAKQALTAVRNALVKNIDGTVKSEKTAEVARSSGDTPHQLTTVEIEAKGMHNGSPMLLRGKFVAKDARVYQVIVVGKEADISQESVKTFMDSFRSN
jgi:hypothetical protein